MASLQRRRPALTPPTPSPSADQRRTEQCHRRDRQRPCCQPASTFVWQAHRRRRPTTPRSNTVHYTYRDRSAWPRHRSASRRHRGRRCRPQPASITNSATVSPLPPARPTRTRADDTDDRHGTITQQLVGRGDEDRRHGCSSRRGRRRFTRSSSRCQRTAATGVSVAVACRWRRRPPCGAATTTTSPAR